MSQPDETSNETSNDALIPAEIIDSPAVEVIQRRPSPKLHAFLAAIRKLPQIRRAAEAAGITPAAHYKRYKTDVDYADAFDQAFAEGLDAIADIAVERAVIGWEELVIYQGQLCFGYKRDPKTGKLAVNPETGKLMADLEKPLTRWVIDNDMVRFILKNRHPDFAERLQVGGEGGGPIETTFRISFVDPPPEP